MKFILSDYFIFFFSLGVITSAQIIIIRLMKKILNVLQSFQQPPEEDPIGPSGKPRLGRMEYEDLR